MLLFKSKFSKLKEVAPGEISMEDFMKVLITYADIYHAKSYLRKIKNEKKFNFNVKIVYLIIKEQCKL